MDTALSIGGDLAVDTRGMLYYVSGREEICQQIYILLSAKKGAFIYNRELGSRISGSPALSAEQAAALAREALRTIPRAEVLSAEFEDGDLTVRVGYGGEVLVINVRTDPEV